jgi:hypothetical protein
MADIQVANTDADLSGNTVVTEENTYTITGLHTYSRGSNAPFACITGSAYVQYLDADKLDGQEGAYYLAAANITGTTLASTVVTSSLTTVGTIGSGTWQGTTVAVNQGGTGATSLTDGGLLLGAGTGAITALGVAANGQIPIGDGTTAPQLATLTGTSNEVDITNGAASITVGLPASVTVTTALTISGTGASSLDVGGGINAGTGDVALVGTDGKINGPLSSTIIDDLSGANLTTLNASNISSGTLADARVTDALTISGGTVNNSVIGGSTAAAATVTTLNTTGSVTCNDDGGDVDFRIESDDDVNCFNVNGGEDNVGIGVAPGSGEAKLRINATSRTGLHVTQNTSGEQGVRIVGGGTSTGQALQIRNSSGTGTFAVTDAGAVTKASSTFRINHPLPAKTDTHLLVHSVIEGPQADLIYRGTVTLVDGAATVDLDDAAGMTAGTWAVLCRDAQCYTSNETGWFHVRGTVTGSTLTIDCEEATCTDTVSWMVVANRKDQHIIEADWTDEDGYPIVEPEKPEEPEP